MAVMRKTRVVPEPDDAPAEKTARVRILETAAELFYREGIRAVGIDTIIARSGVAKMSLYRNFASKDDLVVAFLEYRDGIYWQWWDHVMAAHPDDAARQISDLFASLTRRVSSPAIAAVPSSIPRPSFPIPSIRRAPSAAPTSASSGGACSIWRNAPGRAMPTASPTSSCC